MIGEKEEASQTRKVAWKTNLQPLPEPSPALAALRGEPLTFSRSLQRRSIVSTVVTYPPPPGEEW